MKMFAKLIVCLTIVSARCSGQPSSQSKLNDNVALPNKRADDRNTVVYDIRELIASDSTVKLSPKINLNDLFG
jgi:hypothetical protein